VAQYNPDALTQALARWAQHQWYVFEFLEEVVEDPFLKTIPVFRQQ
jgi:hypothetical protein